MFGCKHFYLQKHVRYLVFMRRCSSRTTMFTVIVLGNVFHNPNNTRKTFLVIWKTWGQVREERGDRNWGKWGKSRRDNGGRFPLFLREKRLYFSHPHLEVLVQKEACTGDLVGRVQL